MSTTQFARRLGVKQPRINVLEKAEASGAASLRTLREAAEAMNCTLIYAIVPTVPLEQMIQERAAQRADAELGRIHHTVRLENQAVTDADLALERQRIVDDLLSGSLRRLWEDQ